MKYLCTWDVEAWAWIVEPDDPNYNGFADDGPEGQYHIEAENEKEAIFYAELELRIDLEDQRYP